VLLIVGIVAGFILWDLVGLRLGVSYWIALPLVIVATVVGLPAAFIVAVFLVLVSVSEVRARRLKSEPCVLARARKASGEEGEVVRHGPLTVWYSGSTNPVPLLMEQMEATRSRFESLLGRETGSTFPLRILCFRKRSAFGAFLKPFVANILNYFKTVDGIYYSRPHRILTLCAEEVPYSILNPDQTARVLFCLYFFLETSPANPPAAWLQWGISKALGSDDDDRARLNRKMVASLSRGTAIASDLFKLNSKDLVKLLKSWADHRNFERYQQFSAESSSVFEYLGGKQAPAERRDRFRAFLNDNQSKEQPEEMFQRHFGFGLAGLFESWREWVREQGIGTFAPLSPHIQDGLLNRVIPLIEDRQAKREDRILAIRTIGMEGYVVGADALIGLLRGDDAIPREEIVWALEAISGMTYGDDQDRWTAWWSSLPAEIRERSHRLEEQVNKPSLATEDSSSAAGDHGV